MSKNQASEVFTGALEHGFLRVPNIWLIILMKYEDGEEFQRVPATFWKFLLVLWHQIMWEDVSQGQYLWRAKLSMRQFHIRKGDAIKWTIALENSNLFKVKKGDYSNRKPSLFVYNQKATCTDWEGFYRGLMRSVQESNQTEKELDRYLNNDEWAAIVKRNVEAQTTAVIDEIGGGRGPAMQEFA